MNSFDATKNGLASAAADFNDYPFLIDEKQVADSKIKEQLDSFVYALANGIGRTKLNKDSTKLSTKFLPLAKKNCARCTNVYPVKINALKSKSTNLFNLRSDGVGIRTK